MERIPDAVSKEGNKTQSCEAEEGGAGPSHLRSGISLMWNGKSLIKQEIGRARLERWLSYERLGL